MSKKVIIVTGAAGLLSFAGSFVLAWLTAPTPASSPQGPQGPAHAVDKPLTAQPTGQVDVALPGGAPPAPMKRSMTEQQLKNLVQEVRQKMQEYNDRLQAITMRERRLEVAQNVLKEDIESLDNLRLEVASTITTLKGERDALLKSRLEIDEKERTNLITIAATYDRMDVTGAGKILISMCQPAEPEPGEPPNLAGKDDSYDDAVKILHYMQERTKGKLLAELATSEPELAAELCQRLKQIVEGG